MSKAQRYKQQQKDAKLAKQGGKNPTPKSAEPAVPKTLKERQAENKEALRKHQASMTKLKAFEEKLHPKPAGAEPEKEASALSSMFFDGGNLNKDQSRTSHVPLHKESPSQPAARTLEPAVSHEKDTAIKSGV